MAAVMTCQWVGNAVSMFVPPPPVEGDTLETQSVGKNLR
jgi:hypothetical protein